MDVEVVGIFLSRNNLCTIQVQSVQSGTFPEGDLSGTVERLQTFVEQSQQADLPLVFS